MNQFAYRTTGLAIKTLSGLTHARVKIHGQEKLPSGPTIFVVNHFTRIETFLIPYHLYRLLKTPVWSLAAAELFVGKFGSFLEQVGAVSTRAPHRDKLMVKTLLTAEAAWIVFPEGRMVKNKKIMDKGRFMITSAGGKHPPHTGAATLALRTEFYRQRLLQLQSCRPDDARQLAERFDLHSLDQVNPQPTCIVPVNLTYYPIRARENALSRLAERLVDHLPERVFEEIMTEGDMLISGVDIDLRFGTPIKIPPCLSSRPIQCDICSAKDIGFDDHIPSRKRMRKEAIRIMERYMSDIYRMTTVNHDHLFAACLKKTPMARMKEENLKRRVFLAGQKDKERLGVHFHNSFDQDQVHLITDDRYKKFSEFIDFAQEKKVVTVMGDILEKDARHLSPILDFHRSRIDNPIAVIANEVEPLTRLQRRIVRLCWQPELWLKRKIARYLTERAEKDFDRDYQVHAHLGVSKPKDVGRPFLIKGDRRRIGVLLAHGYMAAPAEVRGLAEYLGKKGYWVYVLRLKGHGTAPEDLANRTYQDWIDDMDAGYGIVSNLCRCVVVGGFSTGAGLALDLAERVRSVCGVFAVSAPLRLHDMAARLVPAVDAWNRIMARFHLDEARKTFVDNHPENPHINYHKNPISGIRELERLMSSLEQRLSRITTPALVVQSKGDPVVDPKGSEIIFKRLGSTDKQMALFNFDRHGILLGKGADRVYRTIGDFIHHIGKSPRQAPPLEEETATAESEKRPSRETHDDLEEQTADDHKDTIPSDKL